MINTSISRIRKKARWRLADGVKFISALLIAAMAVALAALWLQ